MPDLDFKDSRGWRFTETEKAEICSLINEMCRSRTEVYTSDGRAYDLYQGIKHGHLHYLNITMGIHRGGQGGYDWHFDVDYYHHTYHFNVEVGEITSIFF